MGRDIAKIDVLQRLDLQDINNIQGFVTEYLSTALGGLFGYTRGLLTPPDVTSEIANQRIKLSAFQVAVSKRDEDSTPINAEGQSVKSDVRLEVVRFDPSQENHLLANALITDGYISISGRSNGDFLCVQPYTVETDSANRIFWNLTSGAEVTTNTTTATRTRLRFNWRSNVGAIKDNEAPILYLESVLTAKVRLISAWDDYRSWNFLNESSGNWFDHTSLIGVSGLLDGNIRPNTSTPIEEYFEGSTDKTELSYSRDLGLNMLLAYTRSRLRRMGSEGSSDDGTITKQEWYHQPTLSLAGLKYEMDNSFKRRYSALIEFNKDVNSNITITGRDFHRLSSLTWASQDTVSQETNLHTHILTISLRKPGNMENILFVDSQITFTVLDELYESGNNPVTGLDAGLTFMPYDYVDTTSTVFGAVTNDFNFSIYASNLYYHELFHVGSNTGTGNFKVLVTISGTPA